jgi:pyruvate,water dikinase
VYASATKVRGASAIAGAIGQRCASVHGERDVAYRANSGVDEAPVKAVIVQAMAPAGTGGVIFSVDPTGRDPRVAVLEASFGHTKAVVAGLVEPDTYVVARGSSHLLGVQLGSKTIEIVATRQGEATIAVDPSRQRTRALSPSEVADIARMAFAVERRMGTPQHIEWCYDGTPRLFVLQARPIQVQKPPRSGARTTGAVVAMGAGASSGVVTGPARVLSSADQADEVGLGDVLVVPNPSPEWLAVLDRAVGVVTDRGGLTGHLAVACRELGVPCVVRARTATVGIRSGDFVSVDGTTGTVRSARSNANVTGTHR